MRAHPALPAPMRLSPRPKADRGRAALRSPRPASLCDLNGIGALGGRRRQDPGDPSEHTGKPVKAPRDGRVSVPRRPAGRLLSAGGKVLNMIDLSDVSMTSILPTDQAGRVRWGRLVPPGAWDRRPQLVIPGHRSACADVAHFHAQTVETAFERQKLSFRIKGTDRSLPAKTPHPQRQNGPYARHGHVRLDPKPNGRPRLAAKCGLSSASDQAPRTCGLRFGEPAPWTASSLIVASGCLSGLVGRMSGKNPDLLALVAGTAR